MSGGKNAFIGGKKKRQSGGWVRLLLYQCGENPIQLTIDEVKRLSTAVLMARYPFHKLMFVPTDMFEERALLLSRLGRHEVALAIYAHILKEPRKAEE